MDTSDLPQNHPCYVEERKKIPGCFSDNVGRVIISQFVALRAKSYAFKLSDTENIKAKGIRGHAVKNHMIFDDYKKCLFGIAGLVTNFDNVSIRSFNHKLTTIVTIKLATTVFMTSELCLMIKYIPWLMDTIA